MKTSIRKQVYWLIGMVVVVFACAILAYALEHDFGRVDVRSVRIVDPSGYTLAAKLFRPVAATPKNKMPGILNLHGGANDKNCQDGLSIELARRGFVVLAPDGLGHGDSEGGYSIPRVFGDPTYTFGADIAYAYFRTLPFVDTDKMGLAGHSMGGGNAFKIAKLYPEIKAIVSLDGGVGTTENKNVLFVQPRIADMSSSMSPLKPVDPKAFGLTSPVVYGTLYGSFADGTARKAVLVPLNHHFVTVQPGAMAEAVEWFRMALKGGAKDAYWVDPANQAFLWKEVLTLIALLVTIFSTIPLTNILLATSYFEPVAQPMPSRYVASNRSWWIFATINALIGGVLYYFIAPNGGTWVSKVIPYLNMLRVDGLTLWFLVCAVLGIILLFAWYRILGKKAGVTTYDLGFSFDELKTKFDWGIIGKTVLLGVILFAWMYVLEGISQWALGEEFRFGWPFMRQFTNAHRFIMFVIYLIPVLLFFLINGGAFLFGQISQKEYSTPAKTQLVWWLKVVYASLFGVFIVWAIQYLPWWLFGTGPAYPGTVSSNWAVYPLLLWLYIPEFVVLLFPLTWFYRRTGKIYLGALVVASLAVWFMAAGLNFSVI